jgi:hypothetical protein
MAITVQMRHTRNGIYKDGFVGFSWTYLFFGFFVPLLRGHYRYALYHFIIFVLSGPLIPFVQLILAFMFNKWYTLDMIERGYYFDCDHELKIYACDKLGVLYK